MRVLEKHKAMMDLLPGSRVDDPLKAADDLVNHRIFRLPPFPDADYPQGINWNEERSRSYQRLLHGHTFLGSLTEAFSKTENPVYMKKGMDIIKDWAEKHPYEQNQHPMAYHDETTALRLQYWLKFYLFTNHALIDEQLLYLEKIMKDTADLLYKEEFHSTNTNHGMFQDIALLSFADYFEEFRTDLHEYKRTAIRRLQQYFEFIFTSEGVHKEQSPAYHLEVVTNLKKLAKWLGEMEPDAGRRFQAIYQKTEKFGVYMLRPDGSLPPIGDTEAKPVHGSDYEFLYDTPRFRYAVTGGQEGKRPNEEDAVFSESGYAIFRDDWSKQKEAAYLFFSAAYHTNYHKHSDDLSIYLYAGGEILTEAGPNGYNYQDEYTQYGYSSFGHNTLLVDGEGLPRVDGKYRNVYIKNYNIRSDYSEVTGVNERFDKVRHERRLVFQKQKKNVEVNDFISSFEKHQYRLLWHLGPELNVYVHDQLIECFRDGKKVAEIEFSSSSPIRVRSIKGQTVPQIQGWVFPKMEMKKEANVIEVELSGDNVECTTEIRLSSFRINRESTALLKGEKQFKSNREINYRFIPAVDMNLKDTLVVIFSAINVPYRFTYNYMKTLQKIGANKLFILDDFGEQGSYYIGKNRDFSIETSVNSLIQYIMAKYEILHKNVIMAGSSKGGYAALYFGIKYSAGHIVAGGPQSKLGNFLIKQAKHPNVAEYIAGGSQAGDLHYLNELFLQAAEKPSDVSPSIRLYVGVKDLHYNNHVIPAFHLLERKGYKVMLETEEDANHNDLKYYFPYYLKKSMSEILELEFNEKMPPVIRKVDIRNTEGNITVTCEALGEGLQYAYYVYKDKGDPEKFFYQESPKFTYEAKEPGNYVVRVHVRNGEGQKVAKSSKSVRVE